MRLPFAQTPSISGDSDIVNGSEMLKFFLEIFFGDIEQQVANVDAIIRGDGSALCISISVSKAHAVGLKSSCLSEGISSFRDIL